MCGAGSNLEIDFRRFCYVWCRLETGGGSSESCRVECRLAIVCSIRNRGDAYLETGEGGPGGGLRLGGGFEVVGEIYEEVETGPGFYLVNADCVVLVAVGVGLVVEPKSYTGRVGDRSAGILHPEYQLVEVVRDRNSLGAGLAGTRVIYGASLALLFESHARHHVDLLVVALGNALDGILQIAPDSAVETVLDLRNLIRHVESLGLHRGVSVARTVRTHVASRIGAVRIAAVSHPDLVLLVNVRVVAPARWSAEGSHVAAVQWICGPEGSRHLCVVEDGVVPLAGIGGAYHILRAFLSRGEFEPILVNSRLGASRHLEDGRRAGIEHLLVGRVCACA